MSITNDSMNFNQEAAMAQIHMNEEQRKLKQRIFVQKAQRNNDLVNSDLKLKLQERGQTSDGQERTFSVFFFFRSKKKVFFPQKREFFSFRKESFFSSRLFY